MDLLGEFKKTATRVFGDDMEKKYAAVDLLGSQLSGTDETLSQATKRLKEARARPRWTALLVTAILILAGLMVLLLPAYRIYQYRGVIAGNSFLGIPIPSNEYGAWEFYFKGLNEEEKLLLFGDINQPEGAGRKKGLWLAEPNNPGAYIEYLAAHNNEYGKFPEDMLAVAKEIDPDNAIYYLFQAGELAEDCTKKVYPSRHSSGSRSSHRRKRGRKAAAPSTPASSSPAAVTRRHVEITDEALHRDALALIYQAVEMSGCSTYGVEMMRRRLPLLQRDDHDWVSRLMPVIYLTSQYSPSFSSRYITQIIQAELYRCEQEKDVEQFKRMVDVWIKSCQLVRKSGHTLVDGLVLQSMIFGPCEDFAATAKACGLKEHERYFADLHQRMLDERETRRQKSKMYDSADDLIKHGGLLSGMSMPVLHRQVNDASNVTEPDYRPDRLADHAFFNRLTSAAHWLLLLVIALAAWLWRFKTNGLLRVMGKRLSGVFVLRDWLFVSLWGILLPVAIYWLINGTETIVSAQRFSLGYGDMLLQLGQPAGVLILLVLAPILAISYRLKKVLPLHVAPAPKMIWGAAILALVSIPLFGLVGHFETGLENNIKMVAAWQGMAVLLLLASPVVAMIRRHRESHYLLAKAVRGQLIVTAYIIGSLVMALQVPIYHAVEKHWVAEDQIFKLDEEYTAFTMTETEITRQLFKETDQLLDEIKDGLEQVDD